MNQADFAREIRASWEVVQRLGLSRSVGRFSSLPVDEDHRRVALNADSTLEQIYHSGLSRANYNYLLWDFAYFQFSWSGETEWRLAFWPNPYISGVARSHRELAYLEAQQESGGMTEEDVSSFVDTFPNYGAVPPIRFEYSRQQYVELVHPAAHFHIGRHFDHRWPSAVCLGPRAFVMIVLRLYYGAQWAAHSRVHGVEVDDCLDQLYSNVIAATTMSHDFSAAERRHFHFGRSIPTE